MASYTVTRKDKQRQGWDVSCTMTDGDRTGYITWHWEPEAEPSEANIEARMTPILTNWATITESVEVVNQDGSSTFYEVPL